MKQPISMLLTQPITRERVSGLIFERYYELHRAVYIGEFNQYTEKHHHQQRLNKQALYERVNC